MLPIRFPQCGVLTNYILNRYGIDNFVLLEKTDGLHVNLHLEINNNKVYLNNIREGNKERKTFLDNLSISAISSLEKMSSNSVLDCEYYNNKIYVFDASYIDDVDISREYYLSRMQNVKSFFEKYKIEGDIKIKTYKSISKDQLPKVIDFVNTIDISPETNNEIDGVIFQLTNSPYFTKSMMTSYKLKRKIMNTIDFFCKYDNKNKRYYLYLLGSYEDYKYNKKLLPRETNVISQHNTSLKLILFSTSYFENAHYLDLQYVMSLKVNTNGFNKKMLSEMNVCRKMLEERNDAFDNKIIEMCLNEDLKWIPLINRTANKEHPNSYYVGLSNLSVFFSPLSINDSYFNIVDKNNDRLKSFHTINHMIREYIIDTTFKQLKRMREKKTLSSLSLEAKTKEKTKKSKKKETDSEISESKEKNINDIKIEKIRYNVLDLCGGRGADLVRMNKYGAYNVFVLDNDSDALTQYVSKINSTIIKNSDMFIDVLINAIFAKLDDDDKNLKKIIEDIRNRYEFPKEGFDIIFMNYAIHYLAYSHKAMKNLSKLIRGLLSKNGIFVYTAYNGDTIFKNMKNGTYKVGSFTISIAKNPDESDKDSIFCKMPLPTIDSTGYRIEPLMYSSFVKDIDLKLILESYPVDNIDYNIKRVRYAEDIIDYYRLIYMRIYTL